MAALQHGPIGVMQADQQGNGQQAEDQPTYGCRLSSGGFVHLFFTDSALELHDRNGLVDRRGPLCITVSGRHLFQIQCLILPERRRSFPAIGERRGARSADDARIVDAEFFQGFHCGACEVHFQDRNDAGGGHRGRYQQARDGTEG
ncbi:hypothetical protein D3C75_1055420 [compost metagenome]